MRSQDSQDKISLLTFNLTSPGTCNGMFAIRRLRDGTFVIDQHCPGPHRPSNRGSTHVARTPHPLTFNIPCPAEETNVQNLRKMRTYEKSLVSSAAQTLANRANVEPGRITVRSAEYFSAKVRQSPKQHVHTHRPCLILPLSLLCQVGQQRGARLRKGFGGAAKDVVIGDESLPVVAKWVTSCYHICNTFTRREVLEQRIELLCEVRGLTDSAAQLVTASEMCQRTIEQTQARLAQQPGKLARFNKALEGSRDVSSLLRALDKGGAMTNFEFVGKPGCSGLAGGPKDARRWNTSSVNALHVCS